MEYLSKEESERIINEIFDKPDVIRFNTLIGIRDKIIQTTKHSECPRGNDNE